MNVITGREICDADSEASLTSPASWELTQFLSQKQSDSFFTLTIETQGHLYLSHCVLVTFKM